MRCASPECVARGECVAKPNALQSRNSLQKAIKLQSPYKAIGMVILCDHVVHSFVALPWSEPNAWGLAALPGL